MSSHSPSPIRVLHAVGKMDRAGIETWLMHVLRNIDPSRYSFDFLVDETDAGDFDDEIRSLGCKIHNVGSRRNWDYGRNLRSLLKQGDGYDVVHGHLNFFNGRLLRIAKHAGVPVRIAHSHTDTSARNQAAGILRRTGVCCLRKMITHYATDAIAVSKQAAVSMFGSDWQNADCQVFPCGIDLAAFAQEHDRDAIRQQHNIPHDAWVLGHVGRMVELKNHSLLVETLTHLVHSSSDSVASNVILVLVGDGPLHDSIVQHAERNGVRDQVRFLGIRSDVPQILCGLFDVFLFPSKLEGLGLSIVEAQAAGLPCVISDVIPPEADVIPEMIQRISLSQPDAHEQFADAAVKTRDQNHPQHDCLAQVQASVFSLDDGIQRIESIYDSSRRDLSASRGSA